jgi:sRNA-binding protein
MSSKSKSERCRGVILSLSTLFPRAFFATDDLVRPLRHSILVELCVELSPNDAERRVLVEAIRWYRNKNSYIAAVALGKWRRDIRGRRCEECDYDARFSAREILISRGMWTKSMQDRFGSFSLTSSKLQ